MGVCKLLQFVSPLWNFPEHSTCAFAPSLIQTDERNKKYHSPKKRQEKKEKALQGTFPPPEDNTNCAKAKEKSGAARSASRLTAQAVCRMNCSSETLFSLPITFPEPIYRRISTVAIIIEQDIQILVYAHDMPGMILQYAMMICLFRI